MVLFSVSGKHIHLDGINVRIIRGWVLVEQFPTWGRYFKPNFHIQSFPLVRGELLNFLNVARFYSTGEQNFPIHNEIDLIFKNV